MKARVMKLEKISSVDLPGHECALVSWHNSNLWGDNASEHSKIFLCKRLLTLFKKVMLVIEIQIAFE